MDLVNLNLTVGYQNVEGLHNSTLGCKIGEHIDLMNDIEFLSETWNECDACKKSINNIEGYTLIKSIEPLKKGKKGRKSGGILVLCKSIFTPSIKLIKFTNNYAWLELNKNIFHDLTKNLLICGIYSQPANSLYYNEEIWEDLEDDILNLTTNETPFCIIGDMNGRVGEEIEFYSPEERMDLKDIIDPSRFVPTRKIAPSMRRNCDPTTNKCGEHIINLCKLPTAEHQAISSETLPTTTKTRGNLWLI